MIYLDSSVVLADLLAETRAPRETLWEEDLGSSHLLIFEVWTRINAAGLASSRGERARGLLARINLTEMSAAALGRALEPWPIPLRTLDALHLATAVYLSGQGGSIELASYDSRLLVAAQALGIPLAAL